MHEEEELKWRMRIHQLGDIACDLKVLLILWALKSVRRQSVAFPLPISLLPLSPTTANTLVLLIVVL